VHCGVVLDIDPAAKELSLRLCGRDGVVGEVVVLREDEIKAIVKLSDAPASAAQNGAAERDVIAECDVIVEEGSGAGQHLALELRDDTGLQALGNSNTQKNTSKAKKSFRFERKRIYREAEKIRNADTFGSNGDLDPAIMEEFDFELHNALFDRKKFTEEYNEMKANNLPDLVNVNGQDAATVVKQNFVETTRKPDEKYGCDENIIQVAANGYFSNRNTNYISLPDSEANEGVYETDNGVQIPCISIIFRSKLMEAVTKSGFSQECLREVLGAGAMDLCVTLIGGEARMSVNNHNGAPHVVVLCGGHPQGALGLNAARHLGTQGVRVTCVVPEVERLDTSVKSELELLKFTDAVILNRCTDINARSVVDMILDARLDNNGSAGTGKCAEKWVEQCTGWAEKQKCPVLAIDPPSVDNSPPELFLIRTRAVVVGAPLPFSYPQHQSKPFLVRLAIPSAVYGGVGLSYTNPFCGKPLLPLSRVR